MSATLDLDLPQIALDILGSDGAARTGPHAEASTTAALLTKLGYAAHPALLAFEDSYGGLQLFESDPAAAALVVGPYACLSQAPPYTGRERDLVPVIFAWDDVIYSLDADGRGWTCAAMVEGVSRPSARDGRQLLTQAILWRALSKHAASLVSSPGLHGASRAAQRGLAAIVEASGDTERWWGDTVRLVVEITRGNGYEEPLTYATP